MATNAFIGFKENNSITYIYNHSDGYLEYLGKMLIEHYNSEKQAKALVSLGDVSVVKEKLAPEEGTIHTFDNRQEDVSVFYSRDRGENWDDIKPILINNTVFENPDYTIVYIYVYDVEEQTWLFTRNGKDFESLEEIVNRFNL